MRTSSTEKTIHSITHIRRRRNPVASLVHSRGGFYLRRNLKLAQAIDLLINDRCKDDQQVRHLIKTALQNAGFSQGVINLQLFFDKIIFTNTRFFRLREEDTSSILAVIGRLGVKDEVLEEIKTRPLVSPFHLVQVAKPISKAKLDDIGKEEISQLTIAQIRILEPKQLKDITTAAQCLMALTAQQIRCMSLEQFKAVFEGRGEFLTGPQVLGLDKDKLAAVSEKTVGEIIRGSIAYTFPIWPDHIRRHVLSLLSPAQKQILENHFKTPNFRRTI